MKKIALLMLAALLMLGGCTQIPRSEETGVRPGEYKQNLNLSAGADAEDEKEKLRDEIKEKEEEIEKIKSDLAKLNEDNKRIMEKLAETEELLKSIDSEAAKFPELSLDQASRDDIIMYLNEQGDKLDMKYSSISMIETGDDLPVLFDTYGYAEGAHQLFSWREGEPEPMPIEGATYGKDGSCQWIVEDRYLAVRPGSPNSAEIKVVDVAETAVVNVFEPYADNMHLITDTSSVLMARPASEETESSFVIYDFVSGEEMEILPAFQGTALSFAAEDDGRLSFSGVFTDDGMEYRIEAVITLEELKTKYDVRPIAEPEANDDAGSEVPEDSIDTEQLEDEDNADDSVDSQGADVV